LAALVGVPAAGCAAWEQWKGNREDVYSDCLAFEAELDAYRAAHGRYPDRLEEAGISTQRVHSRVVSYENKGTVFWASLEGNFYRYSGVSGQYWDLTSDD
jgi:hypothetical protein